MHLLQRQGKSIIFYSLTYFYDIYMIAVFIKKSEQIWTSIHQGDYLPTKSRFIKQTKIIVWHVSSRGLEMLDLLSFL